MKPAEVRKLKKSLGQWYQTHQRSMPWRESTDPYLIWLSEVMLQQTQVNTVIPYFERFLRRFPNLETLARAEQHDVLKAWEGLGYYARARNLHLAAQILLKEKRSRIPDTSAEFRKLPGVGEYICAAVMSIAFGEPLAVVDGNVKRVLARLFMLKEPVNNSSTAGVFNKYAVQLLDKKNPGTHNQAMMELGALVCTPKNPLCKECAIQQFCQSFIKEQVPGFPKRVQKKAVPLYHISVGIILKNGRFLITLRKPEGLLGGLWEFPGGKIEDGESPEDACLREIKEEVNYKVEILSHLTQVKHAYTHFKIQMEVFVCRYVSGRIRLKGPVDCKWITVKQIDDFAFPKANHKFFPSLIKSSHLDQ